jgi:hypothetical protein
VAWLDGAPFLEHFIRLARGPGFCAEVAYGQAPLVAQSRKELAAALEAGVRRSYRPLA